MVSVTARVRVRVSCSEARLRHVSSRAAWSLASPGFEPCVVAGLQRAGLLTLTLTPTLTLTLDHVACLQRAGLLTLTPTLTLTMWRACSGRGSSLAASSAEHAQSGKATPRSQTLTRERLGLAG